MKLVMATISIMAKHDIS